MEKDPEVAIDLDCLRRLPIRNQRLHQVPIDAFAKRIGRNGAAQITYCRSGVCVSGDAGLREKQACRGLKRLDGGFSAHDALRFAPRLRTLFEEGTLIECDSLFKRCKAGLFHQRIEPQYIDVGIGNSEHYRLRGRDQGARTAPQCRPDIRQCPAQRFARNIAIRPKCSGEPITRDCPVCAQCKKRQQP